MTIRNFEIPTQVRFLESEESNENPTWLGGIAYGDIIICGDCGSILSTEDMQEIIPLVWVSISEEIKGEG